MNDTMTLSQRADALEQRMSDELDYIVIKSRLYSLADADMSPPPNADALMAKNPKLRVFYYTSGNSQIRVAFTAAMMKLKGAKIPPQIVFPIQLQDQAKRDQCVKGYPQEASATSLIPLSLLHKMYP